MVVNAIKCIKCNDVIYSRATHDMHKCSCGAVAVDGGFDYMRIIGSDFVYIDIEVKATRKELYNDWNHRINKFGLIKNV